ncbi:hypothetical protein PM082_023418 [Marasmius tenuissimus]|nr:hypothetical protein PM082_023418 [Marasmius tenuissimus]
MSSQQLVVESEKGRHDPTQSGVPGLDSAPQQKSHINQRLPNELLIHIFKFHGNTQVLIRVCTWWRDLGIAEPRLWTVIAVDADRVALISHDESPEMQTLARQGLKAALERSRDLPLDIKFSNIPRARLGARQGIGALSFSILFEYHYRWRSVELELTVRDAGVSQVLDSVPGYPHFPMLESLELNISPWKGVSRGVEKRSESRVIVSSETMTRTTTYYLTKFQRSPVLTTLRLPIAPPIWFTIVPGSYPRIRRLTVERCTPRLLIPWLQKSQESLIWCTVKKFYSGDDVQKRPPFPLVGHLTLSELVYLKLPRGFNELINYVVLPKLKRLVLVDDSGLPVDRSRVPKMVSRSKCKLSDESE